MLGHEGLSMLEASNNGQDQRSTYEFIKAIARSPPRHSKKWSTTSTSDFFNADPLSLREKYQDPIVWNSETFASDVNAQYKKTAKQSSINRRGSITQRFNRAKGKEEADWSRSTLVPTPAHVQRNTIDVPLSFPSSSPGAQTRQANIIALVKERFRGAAYFNGKRDYFKLLRCYDKKKLN